MTSDTGPGTDPTGPGDPEPVPAPTSTAPGGVTARIVAAVTGLSVRVTALALLSAVVLGGVVLALSDRATRTALGYLTARPGDAARAAWRAVSQAYGALLAGALGGSAPISETLVAAAPLILTGLAVAVPLRAGLFNIGGEGQVLAGGLVGGFIGFSLTGLPLAVHLPLAVLAAAAGGAVIGWVPGVLKARTGAHEVISTIMLNNTMVAVTVWLLSTRAFQVPGRLDPISRNIAASARFPRFSGGLRVDIGIVVAVLVAVGVRWLVERSTVGFELNAVGANPSAATAAGMDPARSVVRAMVTAGALGGLAGAAVILGIQGRITPGFSAGLGFDGITVALLGRGSVGGSVLAGLLLGGLKAGGRAMQAKTGTSLDLVVVIQALIIVFIAAPGLVRALFRLRSAPVGGAEIAKGWGG